MSITSWILPPSGTPSASPSPGSGFSFVAGASLDQLGPTPLGLAGQLDMLIDPVTLDYIETEDGELAETADSRTMMMIQLELELGASPFDPQDGTRIAAARRTGDPITPEFIQSEALRAAGLLAQAGVISGLTVTVRDSNGAVLRDLAGRSRVDLQWRDLASGNPVDVTLGGG